MRALTFTALSATFALFAGAAFAQTTTDEARSLAAQATAAYERQALAQAPTPEPVAIGDYRADAHNQARLARHQAEQRAIVAYAAGVRSQPIAVYSEDSARAEAQRFHAEQNLAARAALVKSTVAAQ
ncbi:MAG: hypothetical protein KF788_20250 [Piscinibacter sp.]|nr:hypothetical protein [Piscinibacter sp.]